jgi:hypothetical protein
MALPSSPEWPRLGARAASGQWQKTARCGATSPCPSLPRRAAARRIRRPTFLLSVPLLLFRFLFLCLLLLLLHHPTPADASLPANGSTHDYVLLARSGDPTADVLARLPDLAPAATTTHHHVAAAFLNASRAIVCNREEPDRQRGPLLPLRVANRRAFRSRPGLCAG